MHIYVSLQWEQELNSPIFPSIEMRFILLSIESSIGSLTASGQRLFEVIGIFSE